MGPLDLRAVPPRAPREELAGALFLPRSIDKVRATLPGGDLGEYKIEGFTEMMLDEFGIPLSDFTACVRDAGSDEDVAAFVAARAKPGSLEAWNASLRERRPARGDRALAEQRYPWLASRPDLILALDVIHEDDRLAFSDRSRR
jgi:hypothetical protein